MARFRRLRQLPVGALAACAALLAAAAIPAAVTIAVIVAKRPTGAESALFTGANVAAACGALAAVIAFERPRSWSPLAYARQLRARFLELQSTYDAESWRRSEGKEKEDDFEVSPEP